VRILRRALPPPPPRGRDLSRPSLNKWECQPYPLFFSIKKSLPCFFVPFKDKAALILSGPRLYYRHRKDLLPTCTSLGDGRRVAHSSLFLPTVESRHRLSRYLLFPMLSLFLFLSSSQEDNSLPFLPSSRAHVESTTPPSFPFSL